MAGSKAQAMCSSVCSRRPALSILPGPGMAAGKFYGAHSEPGAAPVNMLQLATHQRCTALASAHTSLSGKGSRR